MKVGLWQFRQFGQKLVAMATSLERSENEGQIDHLQIIFLMFTQQVQCVGTSSSLVRRPLNTAVSQGCAVTLQCTSNVSDSYLQWYNTVCVTSEEGVVTCLLYLIYSRSTFAGNNPETFSMTEQNNGTHVTRDLNIDPVDLTDAEVYLCAERPRGVGDGVWDSSAQLIVLGNYTL